MALPFKKKKEESTNDKIIRLYQEGKTVDEICAEVQSRNDIVTGVIQRKLGADAVPDAVIPHEKPAAAEVVEAAAEVAAESEAVPPHVDEMEGLSKLERYMREKKKKLESAANEPEHTEPAAADNSMEELSAPASEDNNKEELSAPAAEEKPVVEPMNVEPMKVEPVSISEPDNSEELKTALSDILDSTPEEHSVSLVDDYMSKGSAESASDKSISLLADEPESASEIPSYTIPSSNEEFAEMDAVIPPDIDTADLSDKPIDSYGAAPEETVDSEPSAASAVVAEDPANMVSKAADKMKAFAMSQIEANNAKIAELENESSTLSTGYAARIDEANTALTISQSALDVLEAKINEAYAAAEQAREEHRTAIAKADDEYRAKLEAIEEEYRNATSEANLKFQEVDDKNRLEMADLDNRKAAAQSDLVAKRAVVAELHTKLDSESNKLTAQIKALKDENAGYEGFLK